MQQSYGLTLLACLICNILVYKGKSNPVDVTENFQKYYGMIPRQTIWYRTIGRIEYLDMVDLELRYKGLNRISHEAIYKG